ncbi:hypothetical protein CANCADRAFT_32731 [Tortispora caseinolytica NRRL Y-17796]|uniref:RRM domain-containing protein n=1 Tax=Tortispora caseinolytica NRRL Y-17796 TaxID=767744 RepID=A0A1E4TCK0_9ASCO|nr:hypothetical protein CANCADRAFT_32731 [Tortispora caseinolytica NRRL Y-17796]
MLSCDDNVSYESYDNYDSQHLPAAVYTNRSSLSQGSTPTAAHNVYGMPPSHYVPRMLNMPVPNCFFANEHSPYSAASPDAYASHLPYSNAVAMPISNGNPPYMHAHTPTSASSTASYALNTPSARSIHLLAAPPGPQYCPYPQVFLVTSNSPYIASQYCEPCEPILRHDAAVLESIPVNPDYVYRHTNVPRLVPNTDQDIVSFFDEFTVHLTNLAFRTKWQDVKSLVKKHLDISLCSHCSVTRTLKGDGSKIAAVRIHGYDAAKTLAAALDRQKFMGRELRSAISYTFPVACDTSWKIVAFGAQLLPSMYSPAYPYNPKDAFLARMARKQAQADGLMPLSSPHVRFECQKNGETCVVDPCQVFIGNVPYTTDEVYLEYFFSYMTGMIPEKFSIMKTANGGSRGFAIARYYTPQHALSVVTKMHNVVLESRTLEVRYDIYSEINKRSSDNLRKGSDTNESTPSADSGTITADTASTTSKDGTL